MKPAMAPPATNATSVPSALYPDLSCPEDNKNCLHDKLPEPAQSYRLQEISQLKKRIEDERDKRAELYKKYHRGSMPSMVLIRHCSQSAWEWASEVWVSCLQ